MYGLLPTFVTGSYLTPGLRRVRRHAGGWAILGKVSDSNETRDEMTYWSRYLRDVATHALNNSL